jgi:putative transcriptional regulator
MDGWAFAIPVVGLVIVVVAIFTLWRIIKSKKSGFPLADERTAKISGKAFQAGFMIGTYYLLALNFYNIINIEFLGGEQLESMPVINSAVIIMGLTVIVVMTYLGRKEDVWRCPAVRTRIKEFRARYDMTQADLALKVGVRRETIVFLEKGKYNPSLNLAHDVAVALKSTIEELFLWDDEAQDSGTK